MPIFLNSLTTFIKNTNMDSPKVILGIGFITLAVGIYKLATGDLFMEYFWGIFLGSTLIGSYYFDFPNRFKRKK